jgi:acetylornithine deacetylase
MEMDAKDKGGLPRLVADLVAIDSVNPTLVEGGRGEQSIAGFIAEWLDSSGLEVSVEEVAPGRPNVIGVRRGVNPDGPSLLLLGHTDTVGVAGMDEPHRPRFVDDRLHGRGAYDMKSGLAAAMSAVATCGRPPGDVTVAAVCDEEAAGEGVRALLASGRRFDAAIVTEPTDLQVGIAHKGYAGFEIETTGRAAHGSRPDLGIDAIAAMGPVLVGLARLDARLQRGKGHPILGTGSLHASLIKGGQEASSYPASCALTGEWRTVPGDDPYSALRAVLEQAGSDAELRRTHSGPSFAVDPQADIVRLVQQHARTQTGGVAYWADSAVLAEVGIPTVLFGPAGEGAHAVVEWVDLPSVQRVRDVLVAVAGEFGSRPEPKG